MKRYLSCDCGYFAESEDPADLSARVRAHLRRSHGIDVSDEQVMWLSRPSVEPTGGSASAGDAGRPRRRGPR